MSVTTIECERVHVAGRRHLALLIAMNLIWGMNLIASKIGVGQFPPMLFTAMRFGALALFLLPMLRIHRGQMTYLLAAAMLTGPCSVRVAVHGRVSRRGRLDRRDRKPDGRAVLDAPVGHGCSAKRFAGAVRSASRWRSQASSSSASIRACLPTGKDWRWSLPRAFVGSLGLIFVKRLQDIRALELQAWIALVGGSILLILSLIFECGSVGAVRKRRLARLGSARVHDCVVEPDRAYRLVFPREPLSRDEPVADHAAVAAVRHFLRRHAAGRSPDATHAARRRHHADRCVDRRDAREADVDTGT